MNRSQWLASLLVLAGGGVLGACAQGYDLPDDGASPCSALAETCAPPAGECVPGERSCEGGVASWCRADGTLDVYACDAEQGLSCTDSGCEGTCAHEELGDSYIGCDYLPTVTLNPVWSGFDFAVAVANTSDADASVRVLSRGEVVDQRTVAASTMEVIVLPWVPELKGTDFSPTGQMLDATGPTRVVSGGAYRLLSDLPVTVYQMSALEYSLDHEAEGCPPATDGSGGCYSYSNDSSLLLPVNALGRSYVAMSWPATPTQDAINGYPAINSAGFVTITAAEDDTVVDLTATGEVSPGAGLDASGAGKVHLDAGDVLEVVAAPGEPAMQLGASPVFGPDLSGTVVHADKPISVIAGHRCGFVPKAATGYCDHLEEAMLPSVALGRDYVVTAPSNRGSGSWPYVLRIASSTGVAHVHFDPPITDDITVTAGQAPVEIEGMAGDLRITSDGPIVVAQYLQGAASMVGASGAIPSEGDPSESMVVPIEQYRNESVFLAPTTYDENYVNLVAPAGASVTLDDEVVPESAFSAIGGGTYVVARLQLDARGIHRVSCDSPIGITVYGYGKYTSYMNPGSLDLARINAEPPR